MSVTGVGILGLTLLSLYLNSAESILVKVNEGSLEGLQETLPSGRTYHSFTGIPFAVPPVGSLRFKDPVKLQKWDGTLKATEYKPSCMETYFPLVNTKANGEDCLYLNVYTPRATNKTKLPVIFWIYGGHYLAGGGDDALYGPEFFMEQDVVLVVPNSRTGALGFMTFDTKEVPGNAGMKDQVMALKWVQENIHHFGGDKTKVTIGGESSGGASVVSHLISPMSKGLFSKAIVHSGSALADWAYNENGKNLTTTIASMLGSDCKDDEELLNFLQSVEASALVKATEDIEAAEILNIRVITPVPEKSFPGVTPFWTKQPWDAVAIKGNIADVPILAGVLSGDGAVFVQRYMSNIDGINQDPKFCVLNQLQKNKNKDEIKAIGDKIRNFYLGSTKLTNDSALELTYMFGDYCFIYPTYKLLKYANEQNKSPVYFFYFTYNNDNCPPNILLKGSWAKEVPLPAHTAELGLIFNGSLTDQSSTETNKYLTKNMVKMWTSFAKDGNPTPDSSLNIKWPTFTATGHKYLEINEKLSTGSNFLQERMDFWNDLFKK